MNLTELKCKQVQPLPDTRNHRGQFVAEEEHTVVSVLPNGWVKICTEVGPDHEAGCHLVDPDDLHLLLQQRDNPHCYL